ncbi:MAG: tetratricopeptide repeat protein [Candidatus Neomarinimicrobiota bacterium]
MKNIGIIILSGILIFNCSNSPEKLLEKGDKYIANSEIERALKSYNKIIDKFSEDSLARKAQYNIAWIEIEHKNNYSEGIKLLTEIVDKYSDLPEGKSANEDLQNFPKWLMNKTATLRADSMGNKALSTIDYLINEFDGNPIIPKALYLKGNIYLNDKKDFYRAINTYQEIVHKYQGTSFEPMSQFMIGYIYANVKTNLRKAKEEYSKFLRKYPEHELAPSVQFELEYLGKQIKNTDELSTRDQ